ncbi:MAG: hypothetical protein AAFQ87_20865 [Bacteroidota bacterium]
MTELTVHYCEEVQHFNTSTLQQFAKRSAKRPLYILSLLRRTLEFFQNDNALFKMETGANDLNMISGCLLDI